jgi:nitrile hydratase subunit beta
MEERTGEVVRRFGPGSRVRVRRAYPPGHTRAPYFTRGKAGIVVDNAGAYRNPEQLAYGDVRAPRLAVYRVSFRQVDLWSDYRGPACDTVCVDVYDNWLEPLSEEP